jgi:hypothetical protein
MSISRTVSILKTNFSDFTYDIYNYVWPVVEFGYVWFSFPFSFKVKKRNEHLDRVFGAASRVQFLRSRDISCYKY